jgi:hypothetical protein
MKQFWAGIASSVSEAREFKFMLFAYATPKLNYQLIPKKF